MHHKLSISEDFKHITKFFEDIELLRLETIRTAEAYEIFKNCDLLKIPRVIASNDNSVTFDFFQNATTFADLLIHDVDQAIEIIPDIAKCLVYLQKYLHHSQKNTFEYSRKLSDSCEVFVHGDFSVHNLLLANKSLILIDWSSSSWGGQQFNHAPEHWDLAWFVLGIYLIPHTLKLSFETRDIVAETLLDEYLKCGEFSQPKQLISFALAQQEHFFINQRKSSKWYSILKHFPEWYKCRRFWKRALNERS